MSPCAKRLTFSVSASKLPSKQALGPDWAVSADNSSNCLRLCFAMPDKQTIRDGVAELARVCYEQTGIPLRSGNVRRG